MNIRANCQRVSMCFLVVRRCTGELIVGLRGALISSLVGVVAPFVDDNLGVGCWAGKSSADPVMRRELVSGTQNW